MIDETKVTLSENELTLVKNVDWILTKQAIIQKVYSLFGQQVEIIRKELLNTHALPGKISLSVPKIYKGENYLQLPYVIMDYPRYFDKEDIFAVRTMFWWGNFFSITLHLRGVYKTLIKECLYGDQSLLPNEFFMGVNEDQWQHHFEEDNFLSLSQLSRQQRVALAEKNNFVKLAIKFPLDKWNEMPSLLSDGYSKISGLLA